MEAELTRVKRGEMTFDEFALRTMPYWRRVAADLLGRWETPPSIDRDDVVQELLLACWRAVGEHEDGKAPLRTFVVTRALWACKRWIHRQRESWGWSPDRPSRFAVGTERIEGFAGGDDRAQERAVGLLERMRLARSERDRAILERLMGCPSVDLVASGMYGEPEVRLAMEFDSESSARRSVYRAALRMAREATRTETTEARSVSRGAR